MTNPKAVRTKQRRPASKDTKFGADLIGALQEIRAHKRGEIVLETRQIEEMSPARVKAIRKATAPSTKAFEARYGIPARTIEGWEQGRKLDVAGRVLLKVIERDPKAVERALAKA